MLGGNVRVHRHEHAQLAEQRLARITHLARDIASAQGASDVARLTAREVCRVPGARAAVVVERSRDGATLALLEASGASPSLLDGWQRLPVEGDHPLALACRAGAPVWLDAARAADTSRPGTALVGVAPGVFAALPLSVEGRAVGAVGVAFDSRVLPPLHERDFLGVLVDLCAQAFARAIRHDAERSERVAAARLGVMLDAGQAISRAIDADEVIVRLGELVVPRFADWAAVDLVDDRGDLHLGAVVHSKLESVVCALETSRARLAPASRAALQVQQTGEAVLYQVAPRDLVRPTTEADEHLRVALGLGARSAMVVPLVARGVVLGAVTLVSAREALQYDETDLRLASKVADHAALALHNAHLIEAERAAREAAQRANDMKDGFLATVSHELRTPLHAILGWATLLRGGALDDAGRARALETIERNAWAQARLVDDVLDVSRIISGRVSLELSRVDVREVLERAIDVVWPSARAKALQVDVDLGDHLGVLVGDRDRLQQVFWNVLSNAVKFTPNAGRVTIHARASTRVVVVRVADSGQGIRADFAPHLFEPFRQQDASTTRLHGGLGLGLSIALHLARLHGGDIRADSEGEGHGATFEIRLPLSEGIIGGHAPH